MITRQAYPTDVNDNQWAIVERLIPQASAGRPRKWSACEMLNAIFYVLKGGIMWRMMPHDLPPWKSVYTQFWRWRQNGVWQQISAALVKLVREAEGRPVQPSIGIIDSQSVKTREGGEARGVDKYKQISGRKRHIVVDTLGMILIVMVHSAGIPDGTGGKLVLQALFDRIKRNVHNRWCRLKTIRADGGYEDIVDFVRKTFGWTLEVIKRPPGTKGFVLLPKRWVVERTFAWLGTMRRLSKDFERTTASSEAMIYVANIRLALRRLAR
jgi:putative transposase